MKSQLHPPVLPKHARYTPQLLPEQLARSWAQLERYGLMIVLLFILVLPYVFHINPINDAFEVILPKAFHLVFFLAGFHE